MMMVVARRRIGVWQPVGDPISIPEPWAPLAASLDSLSGWPLGALPESGIIMVMENKYARSNPQNIVRTTDLLVGQHKSLMSGINKWMCLELKIESQKDFLPELEVLN